MPEQLFQQLITIFSFSLIAALLFQRLKVASIIAYMAVGALIGPYALALVPEPEYFSLLAEFGVVFLLFNLGLEFSFKKMMTLRFAVFGVGLFQVVTCTAVFTAAVYVWGASFNAALMIAGAMALSSTAIVTRELQNNGQLHHLHGQLSVGVLLFQDLVAVIFLVLVPVLGDGENTSLTFGLLEAAGRAAVLLVVLMAVGKWVLPLIYREVSKVNSDEIFLLTTLVIVLLAAWVTHLFELSMPLGAFIAGMMLGECSYKYQIESDIRPFRDVLLGLFFVTIGMSVDISTLLAYWPRILLFTAGLIAIKAAVLALVVKLLGYSGLDALRVSFNLAQAGEFGLALMLLAQNYGIVPADQASFIILIAIFSMAVSPSLVRHASMISRKLLRREGEEADMRHRVVLQLENHVIIGGFGRLGTVVAGFLETNDIPYIAIDNDIEVVDKYRKGGKNIIYGNSNNVEILDHCHLRESRLVILTFKSLEEGKAAVTRIRQRNANVPIIVRCQADRDYEELVSLGANHVFPELLESSLLITEQVLAMLGMPRQQIEEQIVDYRMASPASAKKGSAN